MGKDCLLRTLLTKNLTSSRVVSLRYSRRVYGWNTRSLTIFQILEGLFLQCELKPLKIVDKILLAQQFPGILRCCLLNLF